ncbi:MAG: DUF3365 domain-containing protein [Nitrospirae bacterium]|nr:MAG: DUF3365 domain-containing protein [Nitrospirota bacterium]
MSARSIIPPGRQIIPPIILGTFLAGLFFQDTSSSHAPRDLFSPQQVADYIHAVIEADRTIYTKHVVDRLQAKGIIRATENWEVDNSLLLPAQFLQAAGRLVAEKQHGIRYRLISLWPIYERNGPATEFERQGLEAVIKDPEHPYTGIVTSGRKRYFQAIYADRAISQACVQCHNTHPLSPKRNFRLNDVLGGIVITIPLGE